MTDIPREPLDHEPDEPGWSLGSDGRWYPPEAAAEVEPTEPIPAVPAEPARTEMMPSVSRTTVTSEAESPGAPMWLKVAAVVVGILLLAGIAFLIGRAAGDSGKAPASTTTSSEPVVSTSSTPATTVPSTRPPVTTPPATQAPVTQPPVTQAPVTQPPATQPPATQPPVTQPPATTPST